MALAFNSRLRRLAPSMFRAPMARALVDARITHMRYEPRPYRLSHRLQYFYVPLSRLDTLARPFLARNRFNLYSLDDRDYGRSDRDIRAWVADAFACAGIDLPNDYDVSLLTLPRVLGFSFNPVSFWFCRDATGALRAVLVEVNNTFGERHCYVCRNPDGSALDPGAELVAEKVFHVSPFLAVEGTYHFRFLETADRILVAIDLRRDERRVMSAAIVGRLLPLTSASLIGAFFRTPLPSLKVLLLIHFHAARLYLAGLRPFSKPAPPSDLVSSSVPLQKPCTASEHP
jgi:DUF1365 family protein